MKNKKNKTKLKSHKGQAMMEYLMTYGLALFVILAVLGILVVVVLPALQPPSNCLFEQNGLSCNQKADRLLLYGSNVDLVFQLDNQFGQDINVTAVGCTTTPPASVSRSDATVPVNQVIVAGSNTVIGVPPAYVTCANASPTANSNFKGSLVVLYYYTNEIAEGLPPRMAVATVTGQVESSSS